MLENCSYSTDRWRLDYVGDTLPELLGKKHPETRMTMNSEDQTWIFHDVSLPV